MDNYEEDSIKEMERRVLLRVVDTHWMDHMDSMEELKRGIGLRAYAQKDPVLDYRVEGFDMFDAMISEIKEETVKSILSFGPEYFGTPQIEYDDDSDDFPSFMDQLNEKLSSATSRQNTIIGG